MNFCIHIMLQKCVFPPKEPRGVFCCHAFGSLCSVVVDIPGRFTVHCFMGKFQIETLSLGCILNEMTVTFNGSSCRFMILLTFSSYIYNEAFIEGC